ncbi:hypothetical protein [Vibrio neptunius]|uniref:Prophage protein n=1 Tax=Vibrio neptunius TaxID=170651 RepID=A0ABS3A8I0_9VIBR|nr:hypothetical protein [Vibrio neptunius]MBN3495724.1 hypothetical protein [Vibrio neptunius]MBN3518148.1 hypothetical protein [Vibrio neptunius]MBN3552509.1 hypothetical protein [Vibrio neptunius]MBN3580549.1 hypothetical protein [Vibrio neptunius]MCH9874216.1 hypothetical protein [Vibrio neptunius]
MSDRPDNELLEVMAFIIDSVAQETRKAGRAEVGMYLLSLVLAEYQRCAEDERHRSDNASYDG